MRRVVHAVVALCLVGCGGGGTGERTAPPEATFDFVGDAQGWTALFVDYGVDTADIEAQHAWSHLPAPLMADGSLRISSVNHSDDVYMGWWRSFAGFKPGSRYRVSTRVRFASSAKAGLGGVGGSPGEGVLVKMIAAGAPPTVVLDGNDHYRLTYDKGNQSQDGTQSEVIGNIAVPESAWSLKTLESVEGVPAQADGAGRIWVLIGTESGFEAKTEIFYDRFEIRFEPIGSG